MTTTENDITKKQNLSEIKLNPVNSEKPRYLSPKNAPSLKPDDENDDESNLRTNPKPEKLNKIKKKQQNDETNDNKFPVYIRETVNQILNDYD